MLGTFRAGFRGKASPVHFFWGSFDLATSRFSGRTAPPHPGNVTNLPDDVAREAYSHEVTSAGFWPGNRAAPEPTFYAYAYPTPDGYATSTVQPAQAAWHDQLGEFVLSYDTLTHLDRPDETLLSFFSTASRRRRRSRRMGSVRPRVPRTARARLVGNSTASGAMTSAKLWSCVRSDGGRGRAPPRGRPSPACGSGD